MRKVYRILLVAGVIILAFFSSFTILYAYGSIRKIIPEFAPLTFRMGLSYPPVKNERQRSITQYHSQKLNISLVRTGLSWSYIEANEGSFTWTGTDKKMNFYRDNDIDILLTVASFGPKWNNDLETPESSTFKNYTAFDNFLRVLFNRYKDYDIHKVQFGNEWVSDYQFIGTAEQFVNYSNTVYNIAKEIIPSTIFVLGGIATASLRLAAAYYNYTDFYRSGMGAEIISGSELQDLLASIEVQAGIEYVNHILTNATYDELDLHLYDDYEYWETYVTMMKNLIPGKPIIVSEFGGPNIVWEKYSNKKQAMHLNHSINTLNDIDIEEAYYFKLVQSSSSTPQHRKSSLLNNLLSIKPAYYVMQQFTNNNYKTNFNYIIVYSLIPTTFVALIVGIISLAVNIRKKIRKNKL